VVENGLNWSPEPAEGVKERLAREVAAGLSRHISGVFRTVMAG
jgi:hypothetical protein